MAQGLQLTNSEEILVAMIPNRMPYRGITDLWVTLVCSCHLAQPFHCAAEETYQETEKGRTVKDLICVRQTSHFIGTSTYK